MAKTSAGGKAFSIQNWERMRRKKMLKKNEDRKKRRKENVGNEATPEKRLRLVNEAVLKMSIRASQDTPSKKAAREQDRLSKARKRAADPTPIKNVAREKNKRGMAEKRAAAPTPTRNVAREQDRLGKARKRAADPTPTRNVAREQDRLSKARKRAADPTPIKNVAREKNKRGMAEKRAAAPAPTRNVAREQDRLSKARKRAADPTPIKNVAREKNKRGMAEKRAAAPTPTRNVAREQDRLSKARKRAADPTPRKNAAREKNKRGMAEKRAADPTPAKRARADYDARSKRERRATRSSVEKRQSARKRSAIRSSVEAAANVFAAAEIDIDMLNESGLADLDLDMAGSNSLTDGAKRFHAMQWSHKWEECNNCKERFPDLKVQNNGWCRRCNALKKKGKERKFTAENNMNPGEVPEELEGLTHVEELVISKILPMMSVYRLPLGQYGYRGNIINIPQDVQEIACVLPRATDDISVLVLRKEGTAGSFKDFRVRREKVRKALLWLTKNNPEYANVGISDERLSSLPVDGFFDAHAFVEEEDESERDHMAEAGSRDSPDSDVERNPMVEGVMESTFLANAPQVLKEKEIRSKKINEMFKDRPSDDAHVPWPRLQTENPVNEFNTANYVVQAFPTLFPYGKGDMTEGRLQGLHVDMLDYFQHLMRFGDGRFARHWRFPYFALNTYLRHRAISTGSFYIKRNPDENVSVESLMEQSRGDQEGLLKKVLRFGHSLPGTKQFWMSRRKELVSMIEQIGKLPTAFVTFSSADMQWPDLHRLLPGYTSRTQAVVENPTVCDWFFVERIKCLLEEVLTKEFKMVDFWGRFEYQHRGSVHFHCLVWLDGAPDVTGLASKSAVEHGEVVKYFDELITAVHPGYDEDGKVKGALPHIPLNPASVPYMKVEDTDLDYLGIVMYLHRHICKAGYCQKVIDGKTYPCRFDFPKPLQKESKIECKTDQKSGKVSAEYVPKRNDSFINCHNKKLAQIHRANSDFQAVVNKERVVGYCTKYVTKSEPQSDMMKLFSRATLSRLSGIGRAMRSFCQRVLIHAVGSRDYTSQETSHMLLGENLVLCSRVFERINVKGNREIAEEDGEVKLVSNMVDKYMARAQQFENVEMIRYFRENRVIGEKVTRRKKDAIAVHFVKKVDKDHSGYEDYCRDYLILHKPFRSFGQLLGSHETYAEALASSAAVKDSESLELEREISEALAQREVVASDGRETENVTVEHPGRVPDEAAALLQLNPEFINNDGDDIDWTMSYAENEVYGQSAELYEKLKISEGHDEEEEMRGADQALLNAEQRIVYDEVQRHAAKSATMTMEPLRKIVVGSAGTGKSYLIKCLRKLLKGQLLTIAPTGVAAYNVRGKTVHSALRIPAVVGDASFTELKDRVLEISQEELADVKYVVVEEVSMVGLRTMAMIDKRLRQIFPRKSGEWFGGRSVIVIGDFGQLAPVGDIPLFSGNPRTPLQIAGKMAYEVFTSCTILSSVLRQEGDIVFRDLLQRVRVGDITKEDYDLLASRFKGKGSVQNAQDFVDAVHLFAFANDAAVFNAEKLRQLKKPIANISAAHPRGGKSAREAEADEAGGLERSVQLAVGAKVMLTANLRVQAALCNGTMGKVVDIVYRDGGPPDLPEFVLCEFPDYVGPTFVPGKPNLFPVRPVTRNFSRGGSECARTGMPLRLAWAVTIHKSQGLTLDKAVLDIGHREFSAGLTFVGLSRVRRLDDLVIHKFSFERFEKIKGNRRLLEMVKEDRRLRAMANPADDGLCVLEPLLTPARACASSGRNESSRSRQRASVNRSSGPSSRVAQGQVPFRPLTLSERRRLCRELGLQCDAISYGRARKVSNAESPQKWLQNAANGSCFYMAVSYGISGSHDHYDVMRTLLQEYLEAPVQNFSFWDTGDDPGDRSHNPDRTELLVRQEVLMGLNNAQWASELEIKAMASALNLNIWVYWPGSSNCPAQWKLFKPPGNTGEEKGIYMKFCKSNGQMPRPGEQSNHFVIVLDV